MSTLYRPFVILVLLFTLTGVACDLVGAGTPAPTLDSGVIAQTGIASTVSALQTSQPDQR